MIRPEIGISILQMLLGPHPPQEKLIVINSMFYTHSNLNQW